MNYIIIGVVLLLTPAFASLVRHLLQQLLDEENTVGYVSDVAVVSFVAISVHLLLLRPL